MADDDEGLSPKAALCEVLLVTDHASDIGVEVGVEAEQVLRLLAERGYELAPVGSAQILRVMRSLVTYAEGRKIGLSASIVGEVLDETLGETEVGALNGPRA